MQEKLQAIAFESAEPEERSVTISIRSQISVLNGSWIWDLHSDALYCSDVMSFPAHFEGTKAIIHPDDLAAVSSAIALLADMPIDRLDFRVITTYGVIKPVAGFHIRLQTEEAPDAPAEEGARPWELLAQELIARREAAHQRLRSQLADLGEKLYGLGTWFANKATGETWFSDGVFRIFGLAPQSLNAHTNTFLPFLHPEDRDFVQDAFEQAFARELPLHIEYRIVQPGGEVRNVRQVTYWSFSENGAPLLLGVMTDLALEKNLQMRLDAAEFGSWLQQQVVQQSEKQTGFGYWFLNLVTRKTSFSPNYLRIHGIKPATTPTHATFLDLVHPEDQEQVQHLLKGIYREHVLPQVEYRIIRPDGRQRYLQLSGKLTIHKNKELVMVGVVQDITAQKVLESTVADLNAQQALQDLAIMVAEQTAEMGTVVWLPNGQMLWSDGFYRMLGYKPKSLEPLIRLWQRSVHPSDLKFFKDAVALALNQQQVQPLDFRIISKAGVRLLRLTFRQPTPEDPEAIVGLVQDITSLAALQHQQAAGERYIRMLEEVGQDLVFFTNNENTVTNWNAGAATKTGIKKQQALDQNLFELFPNLREEAYLTHLNTALLGTEVRVERSRNAYLSRPHHYQLTPLRGEQGNVEGVLHQVRDISNELELQKKLGERLSFIENLLNATVDRIVVLDQHMNYLYWNPKAETYYAMPREGVLGKNILEVFPGFRNDPSYQEFRRALKGETVHIPASRSEGNEDYFETYLIPIRDEEGTVNSVLWIVHDLNAEWQLQQQLEHNLRLQREEHRRLSDAQALGHIGSFEWNMGEERVEWSDELYRIIGWEPQAVSITAAQTDDLVHPDDRQEVLALKERSLSEAGFYAIEHRIIRPDGQVIHVAQRFESLANEAGAVTRVHGTLQDISQQVIARQKLETSENLLRSSETVAQTGSYEVDLRSGVIRFSEGMCRLFGEAPQAFEPTLDFINSRSHPDDVAAVKVVLDQAMGDKKPYVYTRRIRRSDGEWRTLEAHGKVACDAGGNAICFIGLVQDITKRKKTEAEILRLKDEAAQRATDKYQALLQSIDEGFALIEIICDEQERPIDFRYLEVNEVFEKHTGLKDVVGKRVRELIPDLEPSIVEAYGRVAQTGVPVRFEARFSSLGELWLSIFALRVGGENSRQVGVIFENITERKRFEQKQQYLLRLGDALRSLSNSQEILSAAVRLLGETLQVARVHYGEVDDDDQHLAIVAHFTSGFSELTGRLRMDDFGAGWIKSLRSGERIIMPDLLAGPSLPEVAIAAHTAAGIRAQVGIPLVKHGRLIAILAVHHNAPREWTEQEIGLVEETAERTWAAVERARAEEYLKKSEAQLQQFNQMLEQQVMERTAELQKNIAILQQSEDLAQIGSWEYEIASKKFNWSDRMYELLGKQPCEQVTPGVYLDYANEACKATAQKIVSELESSHQPFEETLHVVVGGKEKMLRVKGTVICDEGGKPLKMVGVDLDITDLLETEGKLRESQELLAQTVAATPDAIIIFDVDNRQSTFLNPTLSRWTGISEAALTDLGFQGRLLLLHPEDRSRLLAFNEQLKQVADESVLTMDYRLVTGDSTRWVRNRSRVFRRNEQDKATHFLTLLQEVTSEYAAQEALNTLNASLQQKNRELEARNEEITSFAFISSHDLKEPIRKIHTFTDMLRQKEGERLSETGHDLLHRMSTAVRWLDFLMGDILALSRIHAELAHFEQVDLNEVVRRVKGELQEAIQASGAEIIVEDLPVIRAIENQVFYLVKNLLSNAIKFQTPGNKPLVHIGSAEVSADALPQLTGTGTYLKVEVRDNGIGFDQQYKGKVFQIFQRLHNKDDFGGTGMGLAICRKVMENHRGFIDVDSEPGKGTTFCCYFPV